MTQQKIKELLTKTFGEEEANDPDVVQLYTDCLRQAVEEVTNEQSLLDSFAKAAMQGLISNTKTYIPLNGDRGLVLDGISKDAYDIADALMQERERRMKG